MSWGRVENPKKVFTVGQKVRVFIKNINDTKIALSMKFDDENPWNGASEKFAAGNGRAYPGFHERESDAPNDR